MFKPMLAAKPDPEELDTDLANLKYPLLASPKLDGIRATVQNGKLYSRTLKLIPNKAMQAAWGRLDLEGLDGEIVAGDPTAPDCFSRSSSVVMSADRPMTDAAFYVFDRFGYVVFSVRASGVSLKLTGDLREPQVKPVMHTCIDSMDALLKYEEKTLARGYEGIMLRDPNGLYKQGRSTLREQGLVAVKRFVDAEAVVIDVYEQRENTNPKETNELGRSKRSSHKTGKVGKGALGGFVVAPLLNDLNPTASQVSVIVATGLKNAGIFNIGTGVGLTDAYRQRLWAERRGLPGKIVKFRYQKCGTKDAPRIPIFLGFRNARDLS